MRKSVETDHERVSNLSSDQYFVYVAMAANGTWYTGPTKNVEQRITAHNAGRGGLYTRRNRPFVLLCSWLFNSKREAIQAERHFKRLSPEQKQASIQQAVQFRDSLWEDTN